MGEQSLAPRRRVRRYAVVPEEAAYAIAIKLGPQIRALAQRVAPFQAPLAASLLEGLEQLEGVGRAWFDDRHVELQSDGQAAVGREVSPKEAAVLLGVTARQVTSLAASGVLVGRKPRGRWLIDEASVLAYRRQRAA